MSVSVFFSITTKITLCERSASSVLIILCYWDMFIPVGYWKDHVQLAYTIIDI